MNHNPPISLLMDRLRAAAGGRCVYYPCGRVRGLEFAHLGPTGLSGRGRGGRERYYDIRRHPSRYVLLCRHHHALVDGGFGNLPAGDPLPTLLDDPPF